MKDACLRVAASLAAAAAAVALSVTALADTHPSRQAAELLKQKVAAIAARAEQPSAQLRRTTVTEAEVNSYLAYDGRETLPPGLLDPTIAILGTGRLSAHAVVDLDAVRKAHQAGGAMDPMSYLSGRLPVSVTGVLTTSRGVGRFQLESATVGSLPVPKALLQQIVGYYSRSPEHPQGVGLDDPFELPAHIREIQVEQGHAVIVQ